MISGIVNNSKKKKVKTVKISFQMERRLEKPAQFYYYYEILFEL